MRFDNFIDIQVKFNENCVLMKYMISFLYMKNISPFIHELSEPAKFWTPLWPVYCMMVKEDPRFSGNVCAYEGILRFLGTSYIYEGISSC